MRSMTLAILSLTLAASPAWALGGHGGGGGGGGNAKLATLILTNQCDGAVSVVVTYEFGSTGTITLEPLETTSLNFNPSFSSSDKNKVSVTVNASLVNSPSITASGTATLATGKSTKATISSPTSSTLAVTFSAVNGKTAQLRRESGVMAASAGGLLPLLWLSFALGRTPRRREDHPDPNHCSA